ncbi:hypothetical protein NECAME_16294 [Necator americanus]|uniref:SAM-dependent methyltransferase TRM5/TYW2-type domain-containing protein n=1 Tax=Necator americanus TaxID=51031 RepID=W2TZK4_NECAM|nr:hypothetical protein NECAME_16294 [Necator americanus]ETN86501.1 hypothetical protein NECAME_16294 [Necator americanus]
MADDLSKKITCTVEEEEKPSGVHVMMNLPAYAVNFLPAFRGMLSNHDGGETAPNFPVKAYCYLFAKAHQYVPEKWYEQRAQEMVREFLREEEASIDLIHHVRTVSSRKEMFCVQLNLSWDFLFKKETDAVLKRACEDNDKDLMESKKKKLE